MKRVLIISYYFPPDGGAGTQRAAKFSKHLGGFGWQPIVLTRQSPTKRSAWDPEDQSLLRDLGPDVQVIRVAPCPPTNWAKGLRRIDVGYPWLEPAFEAARNVVAEHDVDLVFITMSPFDLCYLGWKVRDELGVPVVYDLRDPWALDGWRIYSTKRKWKLDRQAMVQTLQNADGVIANTPASQQAILAAIPGVDASRVCTIPNGYDEDDFEQGKDVQLSDHIGQDAFCLVHTGTLHSSTLYQYRGLTGWLKRLRHYRPEPIDTSGRTLVHLLSAIRLMRQQQHPFASRLRLVMVGQVDQATQRSVAESGVAELVHFTGYVPHATSVAWLKRADALFLPLHGLPTGRKSLIVPGKTYEYLAAGRPILGCLPEGDARDLVLGSGRGFCASPCDVPDIVRTLDKLYRAWTCGKPKYAMDDAQLRRFGRRELTRQLGVFLDVVRDAPNRA